jgi:hypothetical protein
MDLIGHFLGIGISVVVFIAMGLVTFKMVGPMMKDANKMLAGAHQMIHAQTAAANLRMTGIPAQARVTVVRPTGTLMNYQPECQVDLDVWPAGRQPYRASILSVIHQVAMPRVQPGMTVPVKIDPANPLNVVLDV